MELGEETQHRRWRTKYRRNTVPQLPARLIENSQKIHIDRRVTILCIFRRRTIMLVLYSGRR